MAIAARHLKAAATIVMPDDAPRSKLEATRAHGARVVTYDRRIQNREKIAEGILQETGATLVPPFDHPLIMAGQGTAAMELLEETGPLDALVTPVGGGGLLSGCATIAQAVQPAIRVFGAEPEGANDTFLTMLAGEPVTVPHPETHCRRPPLAAARRADVRRHAAQSGTHRPGKRRRDPEHGEVPAAAAQNSGGTQARVPSAPRHYFTNLPSGIRSLGIVLSGGNVDFEDLRSY